MPPKKKHDQTRIEEVDDTEMSIESPRSEASTDTTTSLSITADLLQQILFSSQASMIASQRTLETERLAHQQALAENQRVLIAENQKALAENQRVLMADSQAAMTALIASLPAPAVIPPKISKIEVPRWRDGEAPHEYFLKYEKAQTHNGIARGQWGVLLQVFLSGAAQAAYSQVNPEYIEDYDKVKSVMLKALRDTPEQADRNWWTLVRKAGETMSAFYIRMRTVAVRRFDGLVTREALFEKVLLSRFLYLLPADQYNSVTMRDPKSAEDAADIIDDLEGRSDFSKHHLAEGSRHGQSSHSYYRRDNGQRGYHGYSKGGGYQGSNASNGSAPSAGSGTQDSAGKGKGVVSSPNPPAAGSANGSSGSNQSEKKKPIICYSCKEPGHIKPNCPNRQRRLSPCDESDDENESAEPNWVDGWVGDHKIKGMRYDSGCDRTVVDKKYVPIEAYLGKQVTLKGWRGKQTSNHELARVTIKVGKVVHKQKKVAVASDMEYPALLGADMSRAIRCEIMRSVMEEWAGESVDESNESEGETPKDAKECEGVRITRAQARKEREEDEADMVASEQSECSPTPLEDIFDFAEELFEDDPIATPVAELSAWPGMVTEDTQIPLMSDKSNLVQEQAADVTLKPLHELAAALEKGYRYEDGILLQGEEDELGDLTSRVVVPIGRRQALIDMAHSGLVSGHFEVKKTYAKLSCHFIWPRMYVEVKAFVRTCAGCQRAARNTNARAPLQPLPCIGEPFKLVAFDLVGPIPKSVSGYRYILTMMDMFSKYPKAIALKRVDNESVLEAMLEVFSRHGIPETILTDQGSVFMSRLTKLVCHTLGIEQIRTSPYHPQSDGALERWHASLKGMLKRSEADLKYWDRHLRYLLFAYRDTPHCITGFSPFSLLFGREVKGPLSLVHSSWLHGECEGVEAGVWLTALKQQMAQMAQVVSQREKLAKTKMKQAFDKSAKEKTFEIGDLVLVRKPGLKKKLGDSWDGPFEILEKTSPLNYKIKTPGDSRRSKVLHVNLLKKWSTPGARIHGVAVVHEEEGESESPQGLMLSRDGFVPTAEQQGMLDDVLGQYGDVLCATPGKTDAITMSMNTGESAPIRSHPYRIPPRWKEEVKGQIDQLLQLGIIEASESPWSSAVVTVRKKDGGVRICVDYRGVNGVTAPDPYQMPFIEDILDTLSSAKFMSKVDLNKGFHQIPIRKEDMEKTAFCTPWGKFQFTRMPFGLRNGPAVFQRLMDNLLHDDLDFSRVYIDDIVVFSTTWDQHCKHLGMVLERLKRAGLTANVTKCQWGQVRCEFLGHMVGEGKVSPAECKILALKDYQQPITKKNIRQFLGLAGYYRKFIKDYADHSFYLTEATRKSAPDRVTWSDSMLTEFMYLKTILCSVPSLTLPSVQDNFLLQTDASGLGIGAILSVVRQDEEYPVAYFSRKLKPREQRYSATELEGLAVIAAVQHFDVYLVTHPFVVETDHRALVFLNSSRHANGRLARWALALQPYTFSLRYREGIKNANADAFSRSFEDSITKESRPSEEDFRPSEEGGDVMPRPNIGRATT